MKNLKIVWSVKSACGPKREKNEDSVFPNSSGVGKPPFKAGVFDGMGGHKKGEVASLIASETMEMNLSNLEDYVVEANKKILDYQQTNSDSEGMGTTMTAIEINDQSTLKIAHVGDSRCYVLSNRQLIQLTEDENVPGYQNVLLQALGTKKKLDIQTIDFQLTSGDVIFLCTDGVYNEFGQEYLKKRLQDGVAADTLISELLLQEPKDNATALIINVI